MNKLPQTFLGDFFDIYPGFLSITSVRAFANMAFLLGVKIP
jgi:hypothetical protein